MTYRVLIMACSQRKKDGPEYMPAVDRYDGPLWQTLRTTALPANLAVMVVSAKYGLCQAHTAIDNYDLRLTPEIAEAMRCRYTGTFERFRELRRFMHSPVVELRDAAEVIRERRGDVHRELFEDVAIVGGHLYIEAMRRQVVQAQYRDGTWTIDPRARVVEINGAIGVMRRELRAWICDGDRARLEPVA